MNTGNTRNTHRSERFDRRAFTLIEMLGVLAIVAILAAMLVPSVMKRASESAKAKEDADIVTLGDALKAHILRNRRVPAASTWATNVATELSLAATTVLTVGGNTRVYLTHPSMALGTPATNLLPYVQTSAGSADPGANARVLLVSSVAGALPVSSGPAASAAAFDEIWNVGRNQKPASWTGYSGTGEDIKIYRLNLGSLLHRILLNDLDTDDVAYYGADGNTTNAISTYIERWFFEGTALSLWSSNIVHHRDFVKSEKSFFFEDGYWSDFMRVGPPVYTPTSVTASNIFNINDQFMLQPGNNSATTQQIVDAFYWYLTTYTAWSDTQFTNNLRFQVVQGAQNILEGYLLQITP